MFALLSSLLFLWFLSKMSLGGGRGIVNLLWDLVDGVDHHDREDEAGGGRDSMNWSRSTNGNQNAENAFSWKSKTRMRFEMVKSLVRIWIQKGSEIRTSLDFKWSKRGWVAQMVRIWNWIWNLEAQPFEIPTNGRYFVKQKMVGTIAVAKPNHLKTEPFEIQPSKSPDFKW